MYDTWATANESHKSISSFIQNIYFIGSNFGMYLPFIQIQPKIDTPYRKIQIWVLRKA